MYSGPGKININDIFTFLTVNEGVPQNVKCKKTKIIGFTYDIRARGAGLPASTAKANGPDHPFPVLERTHAVCRRRRHTV